MHSVTAAQMRAIDRAAIDVYGVPAARLMERAGTAVTVEALKIAKKTASILVVSGYGNNGGDGFVTARQLIDSGFHVTVFLAGKPKLLTPEAEDNLGELIKRGNRAEMLSDIEGIDKAFEALGTCDLVIDAIFGTGIHGVLEEFYKVLIEKLNSLGAAVISIDLPSGLDADTGRACPVAVQAFKTVALAFPKTGFKNPESKKYTGEVVIADIGIPAAAADEIFAKAEGDEDKT